MVNPRNNISREATVECVTLIWLTREITCHVRRQQSRDILFQGLTKSVADIGHTLWQFGWNYLYPSTNELGGWGWGRRPGGSDQSGGLSICWLVFKSSIWNLLHMYMTYFPWDRRRGSCVKPLFRNYYISKRMCVSNFIHSFHVIWFQLMCYGLPYFLWQSWENGILISLIFKMYLTVLKVYLIVEASCVCYLN